MSADSQPLLPRVLIVAALLGYAGMAAAGAWRDPAAWRWWHAVPAAGLVGLPALAYFVSRETHRESGQLPAVVGLSLIVLVFSVVQGSGGVQSSPLSPALFLLPALLAWLQPLARATLNWALCAALSAGVFVAGGMNPEELDSLLARVLFYGLFSLGLGALLAFERRGRMRLESVVANLRSDREELRKESVLELPPPQARLEASVSTRSSQLSVHLPQVIENDLDALARYLERALGEVLGRLSKVAPARTVALYLLDASAEKLRLREAISDYELDGSVRIGHGEGLIGWVLENASPVAMNEFDAVRYRLPYYGRRRDVGSFLAVPVPGGRNREGGMEREAVGVLCADAPVEGAYGEQQQQIFVMAAQQVAEILDNARTLQRVHEEKREFEGLHTFSTLLSGSLRAEDIAPALLRSAGKIASWDFGAVAVVPAAKGARPKIIAATGQGADRVQGREIGSNTSRAGWVLQTGQALPLSSRASGGRPLLFDKEKLPRFESAIILPFTSETAEGVLGCLVLAARRPRRLGSFGLRLLDLLSHQATSALLNARLFERMEALATTDGLTGLYNHRTFQERLSSELARAQRTAQSVCVALTDIDHFKKFNDTYGHPVGDAVLRHLAQIYRKSIREIDLVARYGGEEFVFIFPETDLRRAAEIGERLRRHVEKSVLEEAGHRLRITISMGIAAFPAHATEKSRLIDCADKALYRSKQAGRNRVTLWDPAAERAKLAV